MTARAESGRERVDPRLSSCWLLLVAACALAVESGALVAGGVACLLVVSLLVGLKLRLVGHGLLATALVGLQIFFMRWVFGEEGVLAAGMGAALEGGVLVPILSGSAETAARLGALLLAAMQFHQLTRPSDLTQLLTRRGIPHRWAALPAIALRFVPLMQAELTAVWESQASRGLPTERPRDKLKALLPVGLPFVYRSMRRANDLALAMELRGFGVLARPTFLSELRMSPAERAASGGLLAATLAVLLV